MEIIIYYWVYAYVNQFEKGKMSTRRGLRQSTRSESEQQTQTDSGSEPHISATPEGSTPHASSSRARRPKCPSVADIKKNWLKDDGGRYKFVRQASSG